MSVLLGLSKGGNICKQACLIEHPEVSQLVSAHLHQSTPCHNCSLKGMPSRAWRSLCWIRGEACTGTLLVLSHTKSLGSAISRIRLTKPCLPPYITEHAVRSRWNALYLCSESLLFPATLFPDELVVTLHPFALAWMQQPGLLDLQSFSYQYAEDAEPGEMLTERSRSRSASICSQAAL